MDVMRLGAIFFSMVLVNNYVLVKFLGICPFLGVSKKLDSSVGMSAAVIFVMIMATAVTWPIDKFILQANDLTYLRTITFILVIAALVQLVEIILKKYAPSCIFCHEKSDLIEFNGQKICHKCAKSISNEVL